MPSAWLFDSEATITRRWPTPEPDVLGRPTSAPEVLDPVPCRVSAPTATDLAMAGDGKRVIEAVLYFPPGQAVYETDLIEVSGRGFAAPAAPAVTVAPPSQVGYVRVPVRWVEDHR